MGGVLSSKPRRDITEADRAVLTLKTQRRRIEEQRKRLHTLIDRELIVARTLLAQQRRDRALLALRKKRMQEAQLDQLDKWLINVEEMLASVESTQRQGRVFSALKLGSEALKQLQAEVPLEAVEQLMSDTAEASQYEAAVRQLLGQSWTEADEDEAEGELERLEAQLLDAEVLEMPSVPTAAREELEERARAEEEALQGLPEVPTHAVRPAGHVPSARQLEQALPAS